MKTLLATFFVLPLCMPLQAQNSAAANKAKAEMICTACHGLELAEGQTLTKRDWVEVVNNMVAKGAEGSKDDLEMVINYLATTSGPDIKVNTATAKELEAMLDISDKDAAAIVSYRQEKGNFKSFDDLTKVPGVPRNKLDGLKDKIKF
jgi:competence protein ComEA